MNTPSYDVIGLGMSLIDSLLQVDEFPKEGGVTEAAESRMMGGGPVPTALCAAARLGASCAIVDRVGDDWRGRLVENEYQGYGVSTDFLQLGVGQTTGMSSVLVRQGDGERHIVFSPGDWQALTVEELPREAISGAKVLHLNGRHWPACVEAARWVRQAGGEVSFDGGANRYDTKFEPLLELVDILIVARDFAEKASSSSDVVDQLPHLIGYGASIVGITDGANGSWFATAEGEVFHQKAYPIESVVDTTGCGDVFHGAFLFAHTRGWSVREAAAFASAVASQNATALGGRGRLVGLSEVSGLLR